MLTPLYTSLLDILTLPSTVVQEVHTLARGREKYMLISLLAQLVCPLRAHCTNNACLLQAPVCMRGECGEEDSQQFNQESSWQNID